MQRNAVDGRGDAPCAAINLRESTATCIFRQEAESLVAASVACACRAPLPGRRFDQAERLLQQRVALAPVVHN